MRKSLGWRNTLFALFCVFTLLLGPLPADGEEDKYDANFPHLLNEDHLTATSAIVISADTGEVIFEKNANTTMYPASTTKIMTIYLAVLLANANESLDDVVSIPDSAYWDVPEDGSVIRYGSNNTRMVAWDTIPLRDLIYATMIRSGNEGANAIAQILGGSIGNYVSIMNETARAWGCTGTNFTNPHGLHDPNHYTTAYDLALIARMAMTNTDEANFFPDIVSKYRYTINVNGVNQQIENTDIKFLRPDDSEFYYYPGNGIKTGTTDAAGYCFVGSAVRGGVHLITVVLNSGRSDRWRDTVKLMEYGFSQYISVSPVELYNQAPITVEIKGYSLSDPDLGRTELTISPQDPLVQASVIVKQDDLDAYARNFQNTVMIEYSRDLVAPIAAGEVVGTLTYFNPNNAGTPVVYNLIAKRSVAQRENAPPTLLQIVEETYADPNPMPAFSLDLLLIILIPIVIIFLLVRLVLRLIGRRKGRKGKLPRRVSRRYN